MRNQEAFYVGGAWVAPSGGEAIDVHEAGTGEVMGRVPAGAPADADAAVRAARAAFDGWSQTPPARRGELLARISAALQARADDLARLVAREVGMPVKLAARIQVGLPISNFATYARLAAEHAFEERVGHSIVVRDPVGVVAAITPWNYPLHQITLKVAPALAAGCTVVLKPSEVAPFNAFVLAEAVHEVGLPPGVFNLVTGYGPVVGEALVRHPEVDAVSFTGSTRAGKRVAELAAGGVKRVMLELGGKSPSVVLEDADLATAVRATVNNCYLNSGQTCTALTRLLVPRSKYDEAARLAVEAAKALTVGDPLSDRTRLGPLTSAAQLERVRSYIRRGIEEGAELLAGGAEPPEGAPAGGYFVKPTVFGRVDPASTLGQEEVFGPVLSIVTYQDEDEAVRIANGTPYGLAAAVWSADDARARRVARRLRAGQVDVNGAPFNPGAPFGGFKQSGYGREGGAFGLEEFLELKSLQVKG